MPADYLVDEATPSAEIDEVARGAQKQRSGDSRLEVAMGALDQAIEPALALR